jgi:hypothetical protein
MKITQQHKELEDKVDRRLCSRNSDDQKTQPHQQRPTEAHYLGDRICKGYCLKYPKHIINELGILEYDKEKVSYRVTDSRVHLGAEFTYFLSCITVN